MYNFCNNRFFIQNPEKCRIYDEDVFIENNTNCPEQEGDEQVPVLVKLSEQGSSGAVRALIEDCPPQQKSSLVNAGDKWTGDTPLSAAAKQGPCLYIPSFVQPNCSFQVKVGIFGQFSPKSCKIPSPEIRKKIQTGQRSSQHCGDTSAAGS